MGLLSRFKSRSEPAPASAAAADPLALVQQARTQARRRLIGAALLLTIGLVAFPMLFETQPRPLPVDIAIEIPSRDAAAPLLPSGGRPMRAEAPPVEPPVEELATPAAVAEAQRPLAPVSAPRVEPPASQAKPVKPMADAAAKIAALPQQDFAASAPKLAKPVVEHAPSERKAEEHKADERKAPAEAKPAPAAKAPEAKPAQAAKADEPNDGGRFVVQIGAFAEAAGAREARMKVEGLGLKTYTQVIESATGRRIRVRVGPYATKSEAEKAAAQIKAGGLQAVVLVL